MNKARQPMPKIVSFVSPVSCVSRRGVRLNRVLKDCMEGQGPTPQALCHPVSSCPLRREQDDSGALGSARRVLAAEPQVKLRMNNASQRNLGRGMRLCNHLQRTWRRLAKSAGNEVITNTGMAASKKVKDVIYGENETETY